jgi:predicted house-cleaning noncanonical NTP pyrophosphatase (MazG superfamily)
MNKIRDTRYSADNQKKIADELMSIIKDKDITVIKDLMGCVSSLMVLEDYKKEKKL